MGCDLEEGEESPCEGPKELGGAAGVEVDGENGVDAGDEPHD